MSASLLLATIGRPALPKRPSIATCSLGRCKMATWLQSPARDDLALHERARLLQTVGLAFCHQNGPSPRRTKLHGRRWTAREASPTSSCKGDLLVEPRAKVLACATVRPFERLFALRGSPWRFRPHPNTRNTHGRHQVDGKPVPSSPTRSIAVKVGVKE